MGIVYFLWGYHPYTADTMPLFSNYLNLDGSRNLKIHMDFMKDSMRENSKTNTGWGKENNQ